MLSHPLTHNTLLPKPSRPAHEAALQAPAQHAPQNHTVQQAPLDPSLTGQVSRDTYGAKWLMTLQEYSRDSTYKFDSDAKRDKPREFVSWKASRMVFI